MLRKLCLMTLAALFAFAADAQAQQREIRGTVTAELNGEPLAGANVFVEGTSRGTLTDPTGNFILQVPTGPVTLRVSLIGYKSTDVLVGANEGNVNVNLERDILDLEGVVVTGQGTQVARRNLANAISSVSAQEIEEAPPAETVEKILAGRVAGANIESNSGAPGGGVSVRMRGVSTIIGESEPLYVIDGIIVSNVGIPSNANEITRAASGSNPDRDQDAVVNRAVDINPVDIESIEILKGASAAALYGSRAANGVILITTKRGRAGTPRISFTQRFGFFDAYEELDFRRWTLDDALAVFGDELPDGSPTASFFNADGTPIRTFDNQGELADRNDLSTESILTVSGGSETTRYFVSGSWKTDEGVIDNTGFEKQGVRVNVEQQFNDRLTVNASTNVLHTLAERGLSNNDNAGVSYYMVLPFTPNFFDLSRRADGTFPINPFERSNPLETAALVTNAEDVWRVIAGGTITFDAFENDRHNVRLLGTAGVDFFNQENDIFSPPALQFEPLDNLAGTSLLSNTNSTDITATGNLIYTYSDPGGFFSSTTTGGVQFEDRNIDLSRIVSQGLTAGQPTLGAGTVQQTVEEQQRVRDLGFFLQEEVLLLDDRLLLTGGFRADRSSNNSDTEEFFFFPKASGSYRFDDLTPWLDELKLRVAWGQSGNQPLFGQKFTPLSSTNNINGIPGVVINDRGETGSPDLEPEKQTEIELGFDVTAFDGNARFEATVFQKDIDDLILERTPAPSTGFDVEFFNGGEMRVRGIELALDATPIRTPLFSWISRTTFARNYSEIRELAVPAFETGGFGTGLGAFLIEEGASATQIVTNVPRDPENSLETEVRKVGDATPDFRIGFSNDFIVGPFELASLWDWAHGQSIINLTQFLLDAGQNSGDFDANPRDFLVPQGDGTVEVIPDVGDGQRRLLINGTFGDASPFIEGASYLKLRELALSYNLPSSLLRPLFQGAVDNIRLTATGRNLVTVTDYSGLDPEVSNFGNAPIARNIDVAPFPPSRSFWLGFDVTF